MSDTLLENVRGHLLADAAMVELVAQRVYPDQAPERATLPYVVYADISLETDQNLRGASGMRDSRIQFDVYSKTKYEARLIREGILRLLDGYYGTPVEGGVVIGSAMLSNHRSDYDTREKVFSYGFDINFKYTI